MSKELKIKANEAGGVSGRGLAEDKFGERERDSGKMMQSWKPR